MPSADLIKIIADFAVFPVVALGAYALLTIPKGYRIEAYKRVLFAGLVTFLFAKLAGASYQPELARPFEILGVDPGASYLDNPGFPSDHALFVTAITLAVWFETRRKYITTILAALVVMVCVGRVLALVHTPADVLFGVWIALVGSMWYVTDEKRHFLQKR